MYARSTFLYDFIFLYCWLCVCVCVSVVLYCALRPIAPSPSFHLVAIIFPCQQHYWRRRFRAAPAVAAATTIIIVVVIAVAVAVFDIKKNRAKHRHRFVHEYWLILNKSTTKNKKNTAISGRCPYTNEHKNPNTELLFIRVERIQIYTQCIHVQYCRIEK